jgi:hypothetical protein
MEETKEFEGPVKTDHLYDTSERQNILRSHVEKMAALGYVMPEQSKRQKTLWDELREEFPCDPVIQHRVWASRIRRMYQKDCGFNPDWDCECDKCESSLAEELLLFHDSINTEGVSYEHEDARNYEHEAATIVDSGELRRICSGGEHCDSVIDAEVVNGVTAIPIGYGWVHLFLSAEEVVGINTGPSTPFITALNMPEVPASPFVPRKMWLRSRSITPTYLSFKK